MAHSIIRQESCFNEFAQSTAGAKGLMQLMSGTAEYTRRKTPGLIPAKYSLFNKSHNLLLGCQHLADLSEIYGHNIILIAAAYNAGRHNLKKWMHNFSNKSIDKQIIFVELIPFKETRNYAQRIAENFGIYKKRCKIKRQLKVFDFWSLNKYKHNTMAIVRLILTVKSNNFEIYLL